MAAIQLAVEVGELSDDDAQSFAEGVREVARDTPAAEVSAHRLKRLIAKMGRGIGQRVRGLVVDVASETAKKVILGQ